MQNCSKMQTVALWFNSTEFSWIWIFLMLFETAALQSMTTLILYFVAFIPHWSLPPSLFYQLLRKCWLLKLLQSAFSKNFNPRIVPTNQSSAFCFYSCKKLCQKLIFYFTQFCWRFWRYLSVIKSWLCICLLVEVEYKHSILA